MGARPEGLVLVDSDECGAAGRQLVLTEGLPRSWASPSPRAAIDPRWRGRRARGCLEAAPSSATRAAFARRRAGRGPAHSAAHPAYGEERGDRPRPGPRSFEPARSMPGAPGLDPFRRRAGFGGMLVRRAVLDCRSGASRTPRRARRVLNRNSVWSPMTARMS
jgi:hypothetical protein